MATSFEIMKSEKKSWLFCVLGDVIVAGDDSCCSGGGGVDDGRGARGAKREMGRDSNTNVFV